LTGSGIRMVCLMRAEAALVRERRSTIVATMGPRDARF